MAGAFHSWAAARLTTAFAGYGRLETRHGSWPRQLPARYVVPREAPQRTPGYLQRYAITCGSPSLRYYFVQRVVRHSFCAADYFLEGRTNDPSAAWGSPRATLGGMAVPLGHCEAASGSPPAPSNDVFGHGFAAQQPLAWFGHAGDAVPGANHFATASNAGWPSPPNGSILWPPAVSPAGGPRCLNGVWMYGGDWRGAAIRGFCEGANALGAAEPQAAVAPPQAAAAADAAPSQSAPSKAVTALREDGRTCSISSDDMAKVIDYSARPLARTRLQRHPYPVPSCSFCASRWPRPCFRNCMAFDAPFTLRNHVCWLKCTLLNAAW